MSSRTARWIFWVGTLVSLFLLVALTVDTHGRINVLTHADRLDAQVIAGKHAFEDHNCNDCHTVLGFGSYYAPDLTRAYARLGEATVQCRLETPEVAFAGSFRKMPQQHLTEQDVSHITAYLKWVSNIENHDWPPQDSADKWARSTERLLAGAAMSPGPALVAQEGCLACHSLGNRGGTMAPRFEWAGSRHSADWIADYLANPAKDDPKTLMPAFDKLSRDQRLTIGEFMVALAASGGR
jgi:nitric oxide reductase subunit C